MMSEQPCWSEDDVRFMEAALEEARRAAAEGEVPVGCVLVRDGEVVSVGSNKTNETRNGTRHAEFVAIDRLLRQHGGDVAKARFGECDLYVTCEPCIMCAGALSLLGLRSATFGCPNDKFGGCGSILRVHEAGCGSCGAARSSDSGSGGNLTAGPAAAATECTPPCSGGSAACAPAAAAPGPAGYGGTYPCRGGLLAAEAVKLFQDFYIYGNPKAPKPHRKMQAPQTAAGGGMAIT